MERMISFLVAKPTMILAEDECLAAALRDGDIYFDSPICLLITRRQDIMFCFCHCNYIKMYVSEGGFFLI